MILVDTLVWVNHLRNGNALLAELLEQNCVVMHPLVLSELACGNLRNRRQPLQLWQNLDSLREINHKEALFFIEQNELMGKGVGYIDIYLLASVTLDANCQLWTLDKRLANVASELGCAMKMDKYST